MEEGEEIATMMDPNPAWLSREGLSLSGEVKHSGSGCSNRKCWRNREVEYLRSYF